MLCAVRRHYMTSAESESDIRAVVKRGRHGRAAEIDAYAFWRLRQARRGDRSNSRRAVYVQVSPCLGWHID